MTEPDIEPARLVPSDGARIAEDASTYLSILNAWTAREFEEPGAAEFVDVNVLVERSVASISADPAGVIRRGVVDALSERGVGRSRHLSSYGWGLIRTWGLCYSDDFHGPIRECLRAPNDHTRVDLAKAVRQTQRLTGPAIFIVLGTSLADIPDMTDAGKDYDDGCDTDAAGSRHRLSDSQRLEVELAGRYPAVVLFGALDGQVRQEVAEAAFATGGVALPITNAADIAAFVLRCAQSYDAWVEQIEAECVAGTLDLRRLYGLA